MSQKMSTGLCNKLHDTNPTKTLFNLGFLKIYAGAAPATADAAVTGTLICTVSNNSTGTGLTMEAAAVGGVLAKAAAEVWSGINGASGTITHYRWVAAGDDGTLSTVQPRVQGTIGLGGTDMVVGNVALVNAATFVIQYFTQTFVPS
jgi:hypothetical protein